MTPLRAYVAQLCKKGRLHYREKKQKPPLLPPHAHPRDGDHASVTVSPDGQWPAHQGWRPWQCCGQP